MYARLTQTSCQIGSSIFGLQTGTVSVLQAASRTAGFDVENVDPKGFHDLELVHTLHTEHKSMNGSNGLHRT